MSLMMFKALLHKSYVEGAHRHEK